MDNKIWIVSVRIEGWLKWRFRCRSHELLNRANGGECCWRVLRGSQKRLGCWMDGMSGERRDSIMCD